MSVDGIIFDFDGTLMDTTYIWRNMASNYIRSKGKTPKEDLDLAVKRFNVFEATEFLKREYNLDKTVDELIDEFNSLAEREYAETAQPKPGVLSALEEINSLGIKMCVATTNVTSLVKAAAVRCGIDKYFSTYFSGTQLRINKDTPRIYELAAEHLGTKKENTWVFEASLYAVKSAKNGGFNVAAVFDSDSSCDWGEMNKTADVCIDSMSEWRRIYG